MRGGIRDVEFTVQTLQLLAGGKNEALRTGNTLEALDRLVEHRELTADDARALRQAYELFRKLEHRLQTQLNTQTHTIPQQEVQRKILSRLVGLNAAAALEESVAAAAAGARAVFDQVLSSPGKSERSGLQAMLEGGAGEDAVASLLSSYGLRDVRKALKSIRVLTSGTSLTGPGPGDTRLREAFGRIAELLLEEIARTPSPDLTLSTLGLLVSAQRFPHQLVELLANERFRRLAVEVCSMGPRLARQLATHPILLEVLATNQSEFMRSEVGAPGAGESPILWKQREELRALVRFVLGFSTFEELTRDLSAIADAILARSLQHEMRRARAKAPLVIVAVGKYGTRELGVDADLDLFFVGRTKRATQLTSLERCASAVVQAVSAVSAEGTLFTVDTRLRPEGRNAPLVIELDSYRRYLESRASLWERQSLTRMRVVAGDADLAQEVEQTVAAFVYSSPLPANWVTGDRGHARQRPRRARACAGTGIWI